MAFKIIQPIENSNIGNMKLMRPLCLLLKFILLEEESLSVSIFSQKTERSHLEISLLDPGKSCVPNDEERP